MRARAFLFVTGLVALLAVARAETLLLANGPNRKHTAVAATGGVATGAEVIGSTVRAAGTSAVAADCSSTSCRLGVRVLGELAGVVASGCKTHHPAAPRLSITSMTMAARSSIRAVYAIRSACQRAKP